MIHNQIQFTIWEIGLPNSQFESWFGNHVIEFTPKWACLYIMVSLLPC